MLALEVMTFLEWVIKIYSSDTKNMKEIMESRLVLASSLLGNTFLKKS